MSIKKKLRLNEKAGFSLIELLVVIAIIGILGAIVILAINPVQMMQETRDKRRVADLTNLRSALSLYLLDNEQYPGETWCDSSIGSAGSACPISPAQNDWNYNSAFVSQLIASDYMGKMPVDPINNSESYYYYEPNCGNQGSCSVSCCEYSLGCNFETDSLGFVWVYNNIQY